jgi:hypothetical protein
MSSDRRDGPARLARPTEFDELFGRGYPNPDRVGCPPREVLVSLARRERPIGDPAYDHIKECSPCYLEGRSIQEADALHRRRQILTWAAAALLAVAAGTGAWMLTAGGGAVDTETQAQLDLRPYAIVRGESPTAELPQLQLPRGTVLLTLLLPTGSEPGPYELEIRDSGAVSKASARGDAHLRDHVTTVDIAVATGSLSPGSYQLAVRHAGDQWQQFPLRIE